MLWKLLKPLQMSNIDASGLCMVIVLFLSFAKSDNMLLLFKLISFQACFLNTSSINQHHNNVLGCIDNQVKYIIINLSE
jgi:hypothetical protein